MEENDSFALNSLTEGEAKDIIKNFIQKASRDGEGKINQTLSVWFSIEKLRGFLKILESEHQRGASPTKGVTDGVRIYFANYGTTNIPDLEPNYPNRNTVVLVSTHADVNDKKIHRDYFVPRENLEEKGLIGIVTDPLNRGMLCPPDVGCDCESGLIKCDDIAQ